MRLNRRGVLASGSAAFLAGGVYVNALHNLFVYDDHRMVVENLSIRHILDLRAIVLHDVTRPMVNLSYAIDLALWGPQPFGFHLTNVLLHMLNVVLLFLLCSGLVEDHKRPDEAKPFDVVAFTAAALFAIHPVMSEAVGYVSGRSEVLCATFLLGAFLCARRWMQQRGARWWIPSVVLWLAALATKEIAVAFPLLLLCYERAVLRPDAGSIRRNFRELHAALIGTALLLGVLRLGVFALVEYPGETAVRWPYVLVEFDVIRRYIGLMFIPEGQSIFHAVSPIPVFSFGAVVAGGTVSLVGAGAWLLRRRAPLVSLGLIWFLLFLLPSSALVVLDRGEPMAEHRVYAASCGLFLALGACVGWLQVRLPTGTGRVRLVAGAWAVVMLVSLGGRTMLRNVIWRNPVALWTEARDKAPDHWLPRLLLGEALHAADRREEAIDEYRRAIALRPEETMSYQKLGVCYIELGRLDDAAATYQRLRQRDPQSIVASIGLGAVAMIAGQPDRARAYFQEAIDHDGQNVIARQSLAMMAESEAVSPAEALRLCEEIRRIAPETPGNDDCIRRNQSRLAASQAK